ncbi:hypothetical protein JTB14_036137 [Gonioctena quinquepunctata]|nr:hypothetical protein JTB14_036137 [Gonioctena quinquepunctata]
MFGKAMLGLSLICLNIEVFCNAGENPIVATLLGKIQGSTLKSRLGRTIYCFRGIRYAKPPINELRFQPPIPVERWSGIYDATKDGQLCPQPRINGNSSEDCLILNTYSTQLPTDGKNPKRPVIVYIHSGGFYGGGSTSILLGPNYYLDQDIVLVTLQYRLASLGFISTGDKHAPGNIGFKDQVEALKWVKNNIEYFGGDPNAVTIQGYSAGAFSVFLHMVSPMSRGLFHKLACMSGSPVGILPIPTNQLELAKKQARLVGCPDDSSEIIVECLKTVPAEKLGESLPGFREFGYDPSWIWTPIIEGDFGQQRFLTDHPIRLIEEGQFQRVPFMTGQTRNESGYKAFDIIDDDSLTEEFNEDYERIAPIAFNYEKNTEHSRKVTRAIESFYLHDRPVDESQLENLAKIYSDTLIGYDNHRAANLIAKYSKEPVYYYCFTFQGRHSYFYLPGTNNSVPWGKTSARFKSSTEELYFILPDFVINVVDALQLV